MAGRSASPISPGILLRIALLVFACALCSNTYGDGHSEAAESEGHAEEDAQEVAESEDESADPELSVIELSVKGRTAEGLDAIEGAKIELLILDSGVVRVKRTDPAGSARFDDIPSGLIIIRVLARGWTAFVKGFEISDEVSSLELELEALEPPEEPDDGDDEPDDES